MLGILGAMGAVGLVNAVGQIGSAIVNGFSDNAETPQASAEPVDQVEISMGAKLRYLGNQFNPAVMDMDQLMQMREGLVQAGVSESDADTLLSPLFDRLKSLESGSIPEDMMGLTWDTVFGDIATLQAGNNQTSNDEIQRLQDYAKLITG